MVIFKQLWEIDSDWRMDIYTLISNKTSSYLYLTMMRRLLSTGFRRELLPQVILPNPSTRCSFFFRICTEVVAVILHGLNGSSSSSYISQLLHTCHSNDWTSVVFHARGCGPSTLKVDLEFANTRSHTYNSRQWCSQQAQQLTSRQYLNMFTTRRRIILPFYSLWALAWERIYWPNIWEKQNKAPK